MGVPSDMSESNIEEEKLSTEYLKTISELKEQNKEDIIKRLNDMELKISDPAVRAFLKMKRLEKDI